MRRTQTCLIILFFQISSALGQIHPVIKNIFYDLPLEKSRKDLRETIINDPRFITKDTAFNNYKPDSFFKGTTEEKALIQSKPDSIKIMLVYGNTLLATKKGQEEDFKDVMILDCKYFFSSKERVEVEYQRILDMVRPLFKNSIAKKDETKYKKGIEKINGERFESFDPFYDVTISVSTFIPANKGESVYGLYIAFRNEDK